MTQTSARNALLVIESAPRGHDANLGPRRAAHYRVGPTWASRKPRPATRWKVEPRYASSGSAVLA